MCAVRDLSGLHTKRLMVNFDTDESVQEREIDILTHKITDVFRHAEGLLKKFGRQGDEGNISAQEKVVRTNLQRSMAKKLQGLSTAFRTSQKVNGGKACILCGGCCLSLAHCTRTHTRCRSTS